MPICLFGARELIYSITSPENTYIHVARDHRAGGQTFLSDLNGQSNDRQD
jgi:hypothetical protein